MNPQEIIEYVNNLTFEQLYEECVKRGILKGEDRHVQRGSSGQ